MVTVRYAKPMQKKKRREVKEGREQCQGHQNQRQARDDAGIHQPGECAFRRYIGIEHAVVVGVGQAISNHGRSFEA